MSEEKENLKEEKKKIPFKENHELHFGLVVGFAIIYGFFLEQTFMYILVAGGVAFAGFVALVILMKIYESIKGIESDGPTQLSSYGSIGVILIAVFLGNLFVSTQISELVTCPESNCYSGITRSEHDCRTCCGGGTVNKYPNGRITCTTAAEEMRNSRDRKKFRDHTRAWGL